VHLVFVILTATVVACLLNELALMHSSSVEQFARALWWRQLPLFVMYIAIVVFVRLYFGTGRWWLGTTVCVVRLACLVINFALPPNLYFREITILRPADLLGGTVSTPVGVVSPWFYLTDLSSLLLLAFVVDASISLWQQGKPEARRRALVIGGSIVSYDLPGAGLAAVVHFGSMPAFVYFMDLPFVAVLAAMAFELSYDVFRAAQLARRLQTREGQLRESAERMSLAAEAANLAVWEWDLSKDEVWTTRTHREHPGAAVSEKRRSESLIERIHIDDRDGVRQALKSAINGGEDFASEFRFTLPDGRVRWATARGRCLVERDGRSRRLLGVSMDITERKQAEEEFRLAVEASPSGILLVNPTGQIVLVNSKIEELFGYRREELNGRSVEILMPERFASEHPGHRRTFFAAPTARAMGAGRELFARRKDGSEFRVEIGLNPIHTGHGIAVLANVVDISARLEAEEEARRRRQQVELLGRASLLGEMTASLAHELNQPLAAITNNAHAAIEYIEQNRLDPAQLQEILTDVIGDSRRASDIISNVRNAIKKGSAIRGPINLNEVVKAVTHMVYPDAAAHFCTLEMSLAQDLPAVQGDPIQIQQVLLNLVRNAFDAMRDTPPDRRVVDIATNYNGDGTISVTVRDHGCGLSEKTRGRLFEQFFTTKEEGLGMGLAIVRSIVEAHGGTIDAENADGGGARFHFRLPASEAMPQLQTQPQRYS
jgi:PAS domain S-box-containing protein